MESKYLLPEEEIISINKEKTLTLTNQRVRHRRYGWRKFRFQSMFLKNISFLELKYQGQRMYLYAGIISMLFGLIVIIRSNNMIQLIARFEIYFGLALILILIYFFSKRYFILIHSNGGQTISFNADGMKMEEIQDFIYELERRVI